MPPVCWEVFPQDVTSLIEVPRGARKSCNRPKCNELSGSSGMLLSTIDREVAMAKLGEHAVVLGASMSGLLAARVLADFYRSVTVVERDVLPTETAQRRGVPQGRAPALLISMRVTRCFDGR